ncbi:hypothetical protein [Microbacterium aurantiacum]|uniref:hypothetical protein n=1 Tax=Microbacterium aurantiacum TaxID=162393 RepID=UPI003D72158F
MALFLPEPLWMAAVSILVFLALATALALCVVSLRRPSTVPLAVATGLVVSATVVVAVSPVGVPTLMGAMLALLAVAVAVVGGNPITRQVLELATGGRVRETRDGGILVAPPRADGAQDEPDAVALLRGGTTIGYLERLAVVIAVIAGYPEAIAVVVAVKGIGRFSELAAAEARERFIIGTLASLLWASVVGALIRLAIW